MCMVSMVGDAFGQRHPGWQEIVYTLPSISREEFVVSMPSGKAQLQGAPTLDGPWHDILNPDEQAFAEAVLAHAEKRCTPAQAPISPPDSDPAGEEK